MLESMLCASGTHARDELCRAMMGCYSGQSYGAANWSKRIGAWGDAPEIVTVHGIFADKYPQLSQLNLDLGVMTHLPELLEFLQTEDANTYDYLSVRARFKQHLGNRIVWRGTMLTDAEAASVRNEGVASNLLNGVRQAESAIQYVEDALLSAYCSELAELHFHGENPASPFVSVSYHEDVAIAVGRHFGKFSPGAKQKQFHVLKMSVPEIDLIHYTDHAIRAPSKLKSMMERGAMLYVAVDDRVSAHPWDREVESFLLYKADAAEIVDISRPAVRESSWNGNVPR